MSSASGVGQVEALVGPPRSTCAPHVLDPFRISFAGLAFAAPGGTRTRVLQRVDEMIGIVLVTHGSLAREFLSALEHVIGPQRSVAAVCIAPEDDMRLRREELLGRVRACDSGAGVVVLTDLFGGTPANLAISIMDQARIEVVAGVNLPALVKLASVRQRPIAEAAKAAQEAGRKYITAASSISAKPH